MTKAAKRRWREKKRRTYESRLVANMPPPPSHASQRHIREKMINIDIVTSTVRQLAKETYDNYHKRINSVWGDLNWGLSAVCPLNRNRRAVLIMDTNRRMTTDEVKRVLKWTPSRSNLNALHKCTPDMLGLRGLSFEVRLNNVDGPILAIKLVDVFTLEESLESLQLAKCHNHVSLGWNKGCEADSLPTSPLILSQLKNEKAMKSAGFASSNVVQVLHVGTTTESGKGATKYSYKNSNGCIIVRPLSCLIDRHKWNLAGSKSLPSTLREICNMEFSTIINVVKRSFRENITVYMESRGFPRHYIDMCEKQLHSSIELTTLMVSRNLPIGIHRDPHAPVFAAVFGHTTYEYTKGRWKNKNKGGSLFFVDGLLDLSYSPRDIVLMDGNIAHGVTAVGRNRDCVSVERFSGIMFSTFERRRVMTPGKYTGIYLNDKTHG